MAGIRINDLTEATGIKTTDNFVVARSNDTNIISGKTLNESFSGVKNAINYGNGSQVYKGYITSTNGAVGTSLQFNTLSGVEGIDISVAGSLVKIGIDSSGVKTVHLENSSVSNSKIASSAVTTDKILTGAVTPAKQSGTLCSVVTKTGTQSIAGNTSAVVTGLSAVVTPASVGSRVMLTGVLNVGAVNAGVILRRTIEGVTTNLQVGIDSDKMTQVTYSVARSDTDHSMCPVPLNYIDSPSTTSPITYTVMVVSTWSQIAYINRGYSEANETYSPRAISQLAAIVLP